MKPHAGRTVIWTREHERFQVFDGGPAYLCRDWLRRGERALPKEGGPPWGSMALMREFLRHAFGQAGLTTFPEPLAPRPRDRDDLLFWQFPCRTEAAAFDLHAALPLPVLAGKVLHCYVGLPWATWIDKERADARQIEAQRQLRLLGVRLGGLGRALQTIDTELRVHTVCQHVYWARMVEAARRLGVTDLWLSHAPDEAPPGLQPELRLHPWHLYAVNVLDPERRSGLVIGKDPAERRILASFIGVHLPHYVSDARLRLRELAGQPGFVVEVSEGKWHFEDVVYRHQVHHEPLHSTYRVDDAVARYNAVLSDSVFALCPAGAGPNSLRLWEALAVGAIPVLLDPAPRMPQSDSLPPVNWDEIVIRVANDAIADLPRILSRVPALERQRRHRLAIAAFGLVNTQRCF